jgi:hypothetical protein
MQFDSSCSKNVPRHKRFEKKIKIKNMLKWYRECAVSFYFNSLWEHTSWR